VQGHPAGIGQRLFSAGVEGEGGPLGKDTQPVQVPWYFRLVLGNRMQLMLGAEKSGQRRARETERCWGLGR